MRDVLGEGTILGYCTNVHSGTTLDEVIEQLQRHAVPVKRRVSPDQPMGIGLWFPNSVASGLAKSPRDLDRLRGWLIDNGLSVFTLNAFPFGDFHSDSVKFDVYSPDWVSADRARYTVDMAAILHDLLEAGTEGTISSLPIGWNDVSHEIAGENIRATADSITEICADSDKQILLLLEPEPGCQLSEHDETVMFFDLHILGHGYGDRVGVCHDICHSAVLFEDLDTVLRDYRACGIRVGKVQISSAIEADIACLGAQSTARLLEPFCEPRYLHQACGWNLTQECEWDDLPYDPDAYVTSLYYDLPGLVDALGSAEGIESTLARVHFHVPIFLESLGQLGTTQNQIVPAIRAARELHDCKHFEVETYAWNVLPDEHKPADLAEGIARELQWVIDQFEGDPPPEPKQPRA